MQLQAALKIYVDDSFLADAQAMKAVSEFFKSIPGRILQAEVNPASAVKSGFTKDNAVYKYGIEPKAKAAFLEYYEHRDQGAPTMGLYLSRSIPELKLLGTKVQKRFSMKFTVEDGAVKRVVRLDE